LRRWIDDLRISGSRVARELDRIVARRGRPGGIVSDNGTELTSNAIPAWSDQQKVACHYIAPGKPVQNAFIESFNGLSSPGRRNAAFLDVALLAVGVALLVSCADAGPMGRTQDRRF
jgi:transposase InsO family protein